MKKPNIIIVGGGAGGLELATQLGRKLGKKGKALITLIDANLTHVWKPRLHEVAAGALNPDLDEVSYPAHGLKHHFKFILGRMAGLDRTRQRVVLAPYPNGSGQILPERQVYYDYLVIAIGSVTNDFNTPGARKHCIYLDSRKAAEYFHDTLLSIYLKASYVRPAREQLFNVAIVGAGATGVELAAELEHTAKKLVLYGFDGIRPENVRITIIEAADRVLPPLSPKASKAIANQLQHLGISVLTGELVTEITAEGLYTQSGKFIPAQLKVWSAGVKAPECLARLEGLEVNRISQLKVKPTLQTTRDEKIFAFGDCAHCPQPGSDKPVPPRAQSAHQQARLLVKSFKQLLNEKPLPEFIYRDRGSLISLSKSGTVGNFMGNLSKDFTFEGKLARLFYVTLYRLHQIALHGTVTTLLLMIRDRLNKRTGPALKLH